MANGVVYVGSEDSNVYALDASTGAKCGTIAPATCMLLARRGERGRLCRLLGLKRVCPGRQDRVQRWSYTTGSGVYSSPAVANGVVYVGSVDHNVYGLDASTGVNCGAHHRQPCVFLARRGERGHVCRLWDDNVYALDASTGAKLWSYTTGGFVDTRCGERHGLRGLVGR